METSPLIPTIEQWIAHLDGLAAGVLAGLPIDGTDEAKHAYIESFRDEFGSRRATDGALLSRVLGVEYQECDRGNDDLDTRLWDAVHGIRGVRGGGGDWRGLISDAGGLVDPEEFAIEHRTLIELCALHALWSLADEGMRGRVNELVDWHTRELQPDNGINRPWGVHVFVMRSIEGESEDIRFHAMLHAQTLVNNCCITLGRPDILSAVILLDGANVLRRLI